VANWFNRKRSRAIGFVMAGVAVGGAVFLPILGWLITAYSWRHAAFVSGLIVIGGGMPVALLMRHKPEQYGLYPDGIAPVVSQDGDGQDGQAVSTPEEVEIGGRQSLKTPAFWFLGLSSALRSIVTTGLTIHFVAMMVDRGFSLTMASTLLGSVALLSIIGRLGLAWLGDILDKRFLLAATMWLMGFSMLGLSQVEATWAVLAMLLVYAIAYGGAIVLPLALQADYFGRRSFATIRGLMQSVQTGGMLVGPVLAGFAYDATESYFMAFVGFGIAALLAGFLVIGIRRPANLAVAPLEA
jgi:MFS family permease